MGFEHLIKRSDQFALDCIDLCKRLPKTTLGKHINGQLIRSSTSVAANYRASCKAYTKKSFLSKLSIVIEESDETEYWLNLIRKEKLIDNEVVSKLLNEAHELTSIFIQSRKTALKNLGKNKVSEEQDKYSSSPQNSSTLHSTLKDSPLPNSPLPNSSLSDSSLSNSPLSDSSLSDSPLSNSPLKNSSLKNIPFVDLKAQYLSIKFEIDAVIKNILENTAFIKGKAVTDFEESFAKAIGVTHCIGVGNGTDALVISLKTLGIGQGDEVIVPANSFIASSEAVTAAGAKVVFVDNHPKTYNLDAGKIERAITKNTKAIMAVHLYGQPADMDAVMDIANKYNLFVIEDTAQGHLAQYKSQSGEWKKAGTFGDLATYSFYPGKNLGAYGDAGAIVTNNDDLEKKARMFANHGRISKYDHEFEGVNSRMDGIQGAILGVKLKYLQEWTDSRNAAALYYSEKLNEVKEVVTPFVDDKKYKPVWHLYVLRAEKRDALLNFLKSKGIAAGIHYPIALPNLQAYAYLHHKPDDFPVATAYQQQLLSIPIFPEITIRQQDYVIRAMKEFFGH